MDTATSRLKPVNVPFGGQRSTRSGKRGGLFI
jgi:hypothetical protein